MTLPQSLGDGMWSAAHGPGRIPGTSQKMQFWDVLHADNTFFQHVADRLFLGYSLRRSSLKTRKEWGWKNLTCDGFKKTR